jgi:hypothetical protein
MNRKTIWIGAVSLGLLLGLTTLAMMTRGDSDSKVTVSFVGSEESNGVFPAFERSERLAFAVRNSGSQPASFTVRAIEDEHGNWMPSLRVLGHLEAGQSAEFYLYLPPGSHPRSVRIGLLRNASLFQKAQSALGLLIAKASGRYPGKQVWLDRLEVLAHEFMVTLDKQGPPGDARPVRDHAPVDE